MTELYPYQEEGVRFLASRPRAYLADGMGLGKTVQACAAAARVGATAPLIVAPASVLSQWGAAWTRWGPPGVRPQILSYDALRSRGHEGSPDLVILDEAHYTKNHRSKRSRAALAVAAAAPRAWLLSGTPMPNHPGELWAPLHALWPSETRSLGVRTYWQFYDRFTRYTMSPFGPRPYGLKNADQLRPFLRGIMLRRLLSEVGVQLPPLRVHSVVLDAGAGIDAELEAILDRKDADMGAMARARHALGRAKVEPVCDILDAELSEDPSTRVVVLAHHTAVLDRVQQRLSKHTLARVDGSMPASRRDAELRRFEAGARVLVGQQTAAGTGLNLQHASEIVLIEPSWVPAENAQAIARIHRIGQSSPCRARIFSLAGTLDEAVMSTLARKTEMAAKLGLAPDATSTVD